MELVHGDGCTPWLPEVMACLEAEDAWWQSSKQVVEFAALYERVVRFSADTRGKWLTWPVDSCSCIGSLTQAKGQMESNSK